MEVVLGIDFGTTNSVVATFINNQPAIIKNKDGNNITPSVVSYSKDKALLVGDSAKRQIIINPENTISSIKRFIGDKKKFKVGNEFLSPHEIASKILSYIKESAEAFFSTQISKAIITVPAYFTNNQRNLTKLAGKLAGLDVLRILNEPTAAALSYGFDNNFKGNIMVFDFGGGTFDVSILEVEDGVFEVKSTAGNNFLGGDDFDFRVVNLLIDDFKSKYNIDLKNDKMAFHKVKEQAEKAKISLSTSKEVFINIPFISADENGVKHLEYLLTIEEFDKITEDLVDQTLVCVENALKDASMTPANIDNIIFVGGSTQIKQFSDKIYQFMGKHPEKNINPMFAVAMGAAIQGNIIAGDKKDIVLLDVNSLTLGVETKGNIFVPIINRCTTIPVRESRLFTTVRDNQDSVNINIYQGESNDCSYNSFIGAIQLTNIPPQPKGVPRVEVIFDIDVDGILNISVIDQKNGCKQDMTVDNCFLESL